MVRRYGYPLLTILVLAGNACVTSRPSSDDAPTATVRAASTAAEHYEIGKQAFMKRQFDIAMREAEAALRLDPNLGEAHRLRGSVLREWKRPGEAQPEYELAIQLNPRDSWSYYNIGLLRYDAGDWEGAETAYEEAIKIEPSAAAYNNHGWIRLLQKRYADARIDFDKALGLDGDHGNANVNLARVDVEQSQFAEAINRLSRVIDRDPENDEALEVRALAYEKIGEVDKAAADRAKVDALRSKRGPRPPHIPD